MNGFKPPSEYPENTLKPSGRQPVSTLKPPREYPENTPRIPREYPQATLGQRQKAEGRMQKGRVGPPKATSERHQNPMFELDCARDKWIHHRGFRGNLKRQRQSC